jgi:hypothetical protein
MLGPKRPFCQSCGMPLSRDELGGGTNADGSRSTEYYSHCFRAADLPNRTCRSRR